ncbi:hypothetical protein ACQEVF_46290 [Nonomuraea polychroma]|uniref:hypothetical protein n=1 Tax=Nonomuraea polychroma TaxID=46176 RepID=UPI003D8A5E0B
MTQEPTAPESPTGIGATALGVALHAAERGCEQAVLLACGIGRTDAGTPSKSALRAVSAACTGSPSRRPSAPAMSARTAASRSR